MTLYIHICKNFKGSSRFATINQIMKLSSRSVCSQQQMLKTVVGEGPVLMKPKLKIQDDICLRKNLSSSTSAANHGTDHGKLWAAERLLSVGVLVLLPATIAFPNMLFDNLTAVSIVMHHYWGLEAIVTDYVRPIIFGSVVPKLAHMGLIGLTLITLGGLFYFNYNDIGIGRAVRKIWSIESKQN